MHHHVNVILENKQLDLVTVKPDQTLYDCIQTLNEHNIGAVPVVDNGKLVGIFSERDVVRSVIPNECNLLNAPVRDFMYNNVITIKPDTPIHTAMSLISERRIRHLPVLDGDQLIGMVSIGDLNHWMLKQQADDIDQLQSYIAGSNLN